MNVLAAHPEREQTRLERRLAPHLAALLPAIIAVGLMLVWAYHDGGYDADTWYWGALLMLGTLASTVVALGRRRPAIPRLGLAALVAFALYVAWSYLSITWAQSPGDALQGSNRALLYLLMFSLLLILPWTSGAALLALLTFALGVGVIALVLLFRLASGEHLAQLVVGGRLLGTTGYFNGSAALFNMGALSAIVLASRRELPGLLRGVLLALAAAGLQVALMGQSRGWLFTLPVVVVLTFVIVRDRLRVVAAAVLPVIAVLLAAHRLLALFHAQSGSALHHAATRGAHTALLLCLGVLVAGTLLAWGERLTRPRPLSAGLRLGLGVAVTVLVAAASAGGAAAATHGDPVGFMRRQWHAFVHSTSSSGTSGSHFAELGSGRYDVWRVSLDALRAHPVGGLGQDNFDAYYIRRQRSGEEPAWTHSLELRLLAHTGVVGFALFAAFLGAAIGAALGARRRGAERARWVAGAALIPLVVWVVHGSIDWFWELPALSGPALGFLAMAAGLSSPLRPDEVPAGTLWERSRRFVLPAAGAIALLGAVFLLGFPYLSTREVSVASDLSSANPQQALSDLRTAAKLDPLSADPGRLGGLIALQAREWRTAEGRFGQAISRNPGGWYAWFGRGLAASALGDRAQAEKDLATAASINSIQTVLKEALIRVQSGQPLAPAQALRQLSREG